jgi:hypothetical protein
MGSIPITRFFRANRYFIREVAENLEIYRLSATFFIAILKHFVTSRNHLSQKISHELVMDFQKKLEQSIFKLLNC